MTSERPIVMLTGPGDPTMIVYHALAKALGIRHLIIEEAPSKRRLLIARAKKLGAGTVLGQLAFQGAIAPILKKACSNRLEEIRRNHGLNRSEIKSGGDVEVYRVKSANDPDTLELLRRLNPIAVAVQGTRILSRQLLEAVGCPFINMHAGLTPMYRGVHGGYWAIATGRPELCGVTVHLVDVGIDTGSIIEQAIVPVTERDSFVTYPLLQLSAGLPLLIRALQDVRSGSLRVQPPPAGDSRMWSHPTAWGYLWRRITRGVR